MWGSSSNYTVITSLFTSCYVLVYKLLCVSSSTSCKSLQKQFVPFQFAISFYKIIGFSLEANLTTSLMIHIQFNTLRAGWIQAVRKNSWLACGFAREFFRSCMLYRPGKSIKKRGQSSRLDSKKFFFLGGAGWLWVTS